MVLSLSVFNSPSSVFSEASICWRVGISKLVLVCRADIFAAPLPNPVTVLCPGFFLCLGLLAVFWSSSRCLFSNSTGETNNQCNNKHYCLTHLQFIIVIPLLCIKFFLVLLQLLQHSDDFYNDYVGSTMLDIFQKQFPKAAPVIVIDTTQFLFM